MRSSVDRDSGIDGSSKEGHVDGTLHHTEHITLCGVFCLSATKNTGNRAGKTGKTVVASNQMENAATIRNLLACISRLQLKWNLKTETETESAAEPGAADGTPREQLKYLQKKDRKIEENRTQRRGADGVTLTVGVNGNCCYCALGSQGVTTGHFTPTLRQKEITFKWLRWIIDLAFTSRWLIANKYGTLGKIVKQSN